MEQSYHLSACKWQTLNLKKISTYFLINDIKLNLLKAMLYPDHFCSFFVWWTRSSCKDHRHPTRQYQLTLRRIEDLLQKFQDGSCEYISENKIRHSSRISSTHCSFFMKDLMYHVSAPENHARSFVKNLQCLYLEERQKEIWEMIEGESVPPYIQP